MAYWVFQSDISFKEMWPVAESNLRNKGFVCPWLNTEDMFENTSR